MKKTVAIYVMILFVMTGCGKANKNLSDDYITINVRKDYPEEKLILQDFMDVEYIPLETTEEFITHGHVQAVGGSFCRSSGTSRRGFSYPLWKRMT